MKPNEARTIVQQFPRTAWADPLHDVDADAPESLRAGISWVQRQRRNAHGELSWLQRDTGSDEDVSEDLDILRRDIQQLNELQHALEALLELKRVRDLAALEAWNAARPIVIETGHA